MATEVCLSFPVNVYHQVALLAQLMHRYVLGVLADTSASALSPLGTSALALTPVGELSNAAVLEAAELQMDHTRGKRPGRLFDRRQAGRCVPASRANSRRSCRSITSCLSAQHRPGAKPFSVVYASRRHREPQVEPRRNAAPCPYCGRTSLWLWSQPTTVPPLGIGN